MMVAKSLSRMMIAGAAVVTLAVSLPAHAGTDFDDRDFFVIERPGQYTVVNNSPVLAPWFVFAFAVTNPLAGFDLPGPTTTRSTWNAFTDSCADCDGEFRGPFFAYSTDISIENEFEVTVQNPNLIGPQSKSSQFFFTAPMASTFRIQLVDREGNEQVVSGTARTAVPEPGSWALMITGFGLLGGAMRWRRAAAGAIGAASA